MVIDSSDRERLTIAKDELFKMLNHEVSCFIVMDRIEDRRFIILYKILYKMGPTADC